jgi:hypothetical protein
MKAALRAFNFRSREIKVKGLRIAVDKIKDTVSAGVHSRDQVRPRDRTLRWDAAGQTPERSLLRQAGKIRHLALRHELREQIRIEAVNPQDYHLPGADCSAPRTSAGNKETETRGAQSQQAH